MYGFAKNGQLRCGKRLTAGWILIDEVYLPASEDFR